MHTVFFDHNSTSALLPEVLEVMLPLMTHQHGNPTSRHLFGRNARDAVELARSQVAQAVGVQASQVVFTASGTEANNFAIQGITKHLDASQLLMSSIEHPCVTKPVLSMRSHGWAVNTMGVNSQGELDMQHFQSLLATPTGLISVMLANNETGVIQPVVEVTALAKQHKSFVHTDAVQALGKIEVDFHALGVHAMTLSSHKIGGPLGAGALVLDKRVDIHPLLLGGGQEKGLRSGTENVAAIVGFGAACALATQHLKQYQQHTRTLRDQLELGLMRLNATIFGAHSSQRLPNTSFFAINNIEGETLVTALDKAGFAVASGSACSSDSHDPSHVLLAMGIHEDLARGAVRVSVGMHNTAQQVEGFLRTLQQEVQRLSAMATIAA